MDAMVEEVQALVDRVRDGLAEGDAETKRRLVPLSERLITDEIRYSQPGLADHITYLRSMTARTDQKIGRDAIERYEVLRAELDEVTAEVDRILGST
jgi:hypothetical protein